MNPATTRAKRSPASKPRRNPRTAWAVGFDKEELGILKQLSKATGKQVAIATIVRSAVRYAAPKMLSGEAPITERLTLTPQATPPANGQ